MARPLARKPLGIVFHEHTTKAALPCCKLGFERIVSKRAKNYLCPSLTTYVAG
jgi:hypothetical protein